MARYDRSEELFEEITKPEPTALRNVPILNWIDEFAVRLKKWVWKEGDIKRTRLDNVIKLAFVISFVAIISAILTTFFTGLLSMVLPVTLLGVAVLILQSMWMAYFLDPKPGKVSLPIGTVALAMLGAVPVFWFLLGFIGQQVLSLESAIKDWFGLSVKGAFEILSTLTVSSEIIAKSQAGTLAISIPATPYFVTYMTLLGQYALGSGLLRLIREIRMALGM